jgi:U3 small nucleolar RNA-associated protein 18
MPKTSVKQKVRQKAKLIPRSLFEDARATHEDSDGSDDIPEKDEAERKLESLLFGDDEGFHGALKSQKERSFMALSNENDDEDSGVDGGEQEGEDEVLDDVADADVCIT